MILEEGVYLQVKKKKEKKKLDLLTLMLMTMQSETHLFFVGLGELAFNLILVEEKNNNLIQSFCHIT